MPLLAVQVELAVTPDQTAARVIEDPAQTFWLAPAETPAKLLTFTEYDLEMPEPQGLVAKTVIF